MRTWVLSVDAPPGGLQGLLSELGWGAAAVSHGTRYESGVALDGDGNGPPRDLVELKRQLEERGYVTSF